MPPYLQAAAAQAEGNVLLAEGKPNDALTELRNAWELWCALEAPYEAARSRVAIGLACRAMGDPATAELEFEASSTRVSAPRRPAGSGRPAASYCANRFNCGRADPAGGGSSSRNCSGKSNRKIAQDLGIS
jgi:hypothetical protein